jgi:uncharacterized protein DUF4062
VVDKFNEKLSSDYLCMSSVPQVMVSSTFFDLKQVRANLARFLSEELGCRPLISEWPSFPIDPDADAIENCRRRVELDADILVLIIGGRYGYVDSQSSKSVTNLEYLAAHAKGIPVYAFVERQVLSLLSLWRTNQQVDFSVAVDDPRVFEFIEEVRDIHKVWMTEFDLAEEIVAALRWRFAHLALQGAQTARRARDSREYAVISQLQGIPLRIALEKPGYWEHKLFAEILILEIEARRVLAEQKRLRLTYGAYDWISYEGLKGWALARCAELQGLIHAFDVLINEEFRRAVGPPGQPGDLELLVFTARSLTALYQEAIEWSLRVRRTVGVDGLEKVVEAMQGFVDDLADKIRNFGPDLSQTIEEATIAVARGEKGVIRISLELSIPGIEKALLAINELVDRAMGRQLEP